MRNIFLSLILFGILVSTNAYAQFGDRSAAYRFINRTNKIIRHAGRVVKRHKNFTGDLAKSIEHQKYAKKLYLSGEYKRSIFHSQRARNLARIAIKVNKGKMDNSMDLLNDEVNLIAGIPSDDVLDKEANIGKMKGNELKDQDIEDVTDK